MAAVVTNKYPTSAAGGRTATAITVSAGERVMVVIYPTDGDYSNLGNFQAKIERKHGALFLPVSDGRGPLLLTKDCTEIALDAPGDYYVNVPATSKAVTVDEVR